MGEGDFRRLRATNQRIWHFALGAQRSCNFELTVYPVWPTIVSDAAVCDHYVARQPHQPPGTFDIYAQKLMHQALCMDCERLAVGHGDVDQTNPQIASDGAGGAIIVGGSSRRVGTYDHGPRESR